MNTEVLAIYEKIATTPRDKGIVAVLKLIVPRGDELASTYNHTLTEQEDAELGLLADILGLIVHRFLPLGDAARASLDNTPVPNPQDWSA